MSYLQESNRKAIAVTSLQAIRIAGERIVMLTAYNSSFAALMDRNNTDVLLVGGSLDSVMQGQKATLPITLDHTVHHTGCVSRDIGKALLVSGLPFDTYSTPKQAFHSAIHMIQTGAQMVKFRGGVWLAPTIKFLVGHSIPVCAHIGLTPQSVHAFGGFKMQGRDDGTTVQLKADALAAQDAGTQLVVMEVIPTGLAGEVTCLLVIPTIGVGAGLECSDQVLVMRSMLDVFSGHHPKFVRNFMNGQTTIDGAIATYMAAVKDGTFLDPKHTFA